MEAGEGEHLRRKAAARPAEAARVLERAVALTELLHRIFSAVGKGVAPAESELRELNAFLPETNRRLGIAAVGDRFEWDWLEDPDPPLDRVLWPIVRQAAELLTWGELGRVRLGDADDCGWLFVDASRNRSRRWCDMSTAVTVPRRGAAAAGSGRANKVACARLQACVVNVRGPTP